VTDSLAEEENNFLLNNQCAGETTQVKSGRKLNTTLQSNIISEDDQHRLQHKSQTMNSFHHRPCNSLQIRVQNGHGVELYIPNQQVYTLPQK
jgi:hypothetical protein